MIGVALPVKVGSGSKVTEPSEFTVYVPSPGIVTDVALQLFGLWASFAPVVGSSTAHSFKVDGTSG